MITSKHIVCTTAFCALALTNALTAQERDIPIRVQVIGFQVDENAAQQLQAMATAGNGRYFPATNQAELEAALGSAAGLSSAQSVMTTESEGNDAFGSANPIAPSGTVQGTIDPKGDSDWYAVTLPTQGSMEVVIGDVPPELDLHLYVRNAEGAQHHGTIAPPKKGAELHAWLDFAGAGTYYLQVFDGASDQASAQPYALRTTFHPGDAFEPNGSFGRAALVSPNETLQASILPKGDQDLYAIELDHPSAIEVSLLDVPLELDLHFMVRNAEAMQHVGWIAPLRAGADNVAVIDCANPGRYVFHVADGNDDARATGRYTLKLRTMPADGYEPNGSFGKATLVQANQTVEGSILPKGDQDFYAVEVDHPGTLDVSITNVPLEVDLHFMVRNADGVQHVGWIAPLRAGADNEASIDLPYPGRWILHLTDGRDDARSEQLYQMKLAFRRADRYEPNGSFGTAAPIPLGGTIQGSILPRGDQDHYVLEVDRPGIVTARVTDVPLNIDIHMMVRNANGQQHVGWNFPLRAGGDTEVTFEVKTPGRYVLHLTDGNNDQRSEKLYTLTTSFQAK